MTDFFKRNADKSVWWIQTYSGIAIDFEKVTQDDIDIIDIATSLSRIPRFTGHSKRFYSVAEHSVRVSYVVPEHLTLYGLLHDATEAYTSDMSSPLKHYFPLFAKLEERFQKVIAAKFNLRYPFPKAVADADYRLLATEKRDIMGPAPKAWGRLPNPLRMKIVPWDTDEAYEQFINRFKELTACEDFEEFRSPRRLHD